MITPMIMKSNHKLILKSLELNTVNRKIIFNRMAKHKAGIQKRLETPNHLLISAIHNNANP